jgi:hypothetical protein
MASVDPAALMVEPGTDYVPLYTVNLICLVESHGLSLNLYADSTHIYGFVA